MVVVLSEPTKWVGVVEACPETLYLPESAKHVENILSRTSTRRHQKALFTVAEPFMPQMMRDCVGISILNSLVKYGTTKTVNGICKVVFDCSMKFITGECNHEERCSVPLGSLLESIAYRHDCSGDHRRNVINTLLSLGPSQLMGRSMLLPFAARFAIVDKKFALSVLNNREAEEALLSLSFVRANKDNITTFCEILFSDDALKDEEVHRLSSAFVFNAFSKLYESDGLPRPHSDITFLLASRGSLHIVEKLGKLLACWPDIHTRAMGTNYAKIVAHLLSRAPGTEAGIALVKAVVRCEEDIDKRLHSRKSSHLYMLSAIAERRPYVDAASETLGTSLAGRLACAAAQYRKVTKPRAMSTQELVLQRLAEVRKSAHGTGVTLGSYKRLRE